MCSHPGGAALALGASKGMREAKQALSANPITGSVGYAVGSLASRGTAGAVANSLLASNAKQQAVGVENFGSSVPSISGLFGASKSQSSTGGERVIK